MGDTQINQWGRWLAMADQYGYKFNDEAQLSSLSLRMAHLPVADPGPPEVILAWKHVADTSLHIPRASGAGCDHLVRLFAFARHVALLATNAPFPSRFGDGGAMSQIRYVANHLPLITRAAPAPTSGLAPPQQGLVLRPALDCFSVHMTAAAASTGPRIADVRVAQAVPATTAAETAAIEAAGDLRLPLEMGSPIVANGVLDRLAPASRESLSSHLALTASLQSRQLALQEKLIRAMAVSHVAARTALTREWHSLNEGERGMLPIMSSLVQSIDNGTFLPRTQTGVRTHAVATADSTSGVSVTAAAPVVRPLPVAVPVGLSPYDAYRLVSAGLCAHACVHGVGGCLVLREFKT